MGVVKEGMILDCEGGGFGSLLQRSLLVRLDRCYQLICKISALSPSLRPINARIGIELIRSKQGSNSKLTNKYRVRSCLKQMRREELCSLFSDGD